jgi:hypothetical protein
MMVIGVLLWCCLANAASAELSRGFKTGVVPGPAAKAFTSSQSDIVVLSNFSFGTLVVNGSGTATVAPNGLVSTTGAVSATGGFPQALRLELKSHPGNSYQLMLPDSVTLRNPIGATMALRSFVSSPGTTGVFGSAKVRINTGGTLQISSNQPGGNYQGDFEVIVTYN